MAAAAVTGGRVGRVVLGRPVIALRAHGRADHHAEVLRALVALLAARDCGGHGGVPGDAERWRVDARVAELEAAGVHIGGRVTARAAAVEAPDRDVVATGPADDRYRVRRWRSGERSGARAVAGKTTGGTLMDAGDGVDREVARGGMALATRR